MPLERGSDYGPGGEIFGGWPKPGRQLIRPGGGRVVEPLLVTFAFSGSAEIDAETPVAYTFDGSVFTSAGHGLVAEDLIQLDNGDWGYVVDADTDTFVLEAQCRPTLGTMPPPSTQWYYPPNGHYYQWIFGGTSLPTTSMSDQENDIVTNPDGSTWITMDWGKVAGDAAGTWRKYQSAIEGVASADLDPVVDLTGYQYFSKWYGSWSAAVDDGGSFDGTLQLWDSTGLELGGVIDAATASDGGGADSAPSVTLGLPISGRSVKKATWSFQRNTGTPSYTTPPGVGQEGFAGGTLTPGAVLQVLFLKTAPAT